MNEKGGGKTEVINWHTCELKCANLTEITVLIEF